MILLADIGPITDISISVLGQDIVKNLTIQFTLHSLGHNSVISFNWILIQYAWILIQYHA